MGRTAFVCKIENVKALKAAIESVIRHNASICEPLGSNYTIDEFKQIDPMRAKMYENMKAKLPNDANLVCGAMEKWTRGIVMHDGNPWLELVNYGGGACSTRYLQSRFPNVGWMGSAGKPTGFAESPSVFQSDLLGLVKFFQVDR